MLIAKNLGYISSVIVIVNVIVIVKLMSGRLKNDNKSGNGDQTYKIPYRDTDILTDYQ